MPQSCSEDQQCADVTLASALVTVPVFANLSGDCSGNRGGRGSNGTPISITALVASASPSPVALCRSPLKRPRSAPSGTRSAKELTLRPSAVTVLGFANVGDSCSSTGGGRSGSGVSNGATIGVTGVVGSTSSPGALCKSPPRRPRSAPSSTRLRKEFTLCPSAAPTPRSPSFSGNFQARPARILVPSASTANDFARVRSGGKPLKTQKDLSLSSQDIHSDLLRVSSAPILISPTSGAGSISPKTPRGSRGMVRKVSKVFCNYPEVNLLVQHKPVPSADVKRQMSSVRPSSAPPTASKHTIQKRVSFADELPEHLQKITTYCSPEVGFQSHALKRSLHLMDSLYGMRRVQTDEETAVAEGVPIPREEENDQGALLRSTLAEHYDCEAVLRSLEVQLRSAQDDACDYGGSRHATAVLSARSLAVVQRKAALLHVVEARRAALESGHSRRDEIVTQLLAGETECPPELMGVRKFINQYTHKGGNPVDADRSDFEAFVASFKLPSKHRALEQMRDTSDRVSQWWAEEALRVAQEGANYVQIRRMFAVAIEAGASEEHPYLLRATRILNDRLADKVLQDAQQRQRQDTEAAARSEIPQVGPASRAADLIEQSILEVIAEGVPEGDRRIVATKKIMKELREADGQRKRLVARHKRLAVRADAGD